ncbi:MAG: hypothetical protein ACYDGN_03690 [Acidimicrobiales bacterium]
MSLAGDGMVSGGPGLRATQVGRCWRVIGIDLWAECPADADWAIAQGRSVAEGTHLKLIASSAPEAGGGAAGDERTRLWLRFVAREDDVYVTDEAICELLTGLAGRLRWSKLVKLEELGGVPAFVPLVSL